MTIAEFYELAREHWRRIFVREKNFAFEESLPAHRKIEAKVEVNIKLTSSSDVSKLAERFGARGKREAIRKGHLCFIAEMGGEILYYAPAEAVAEAGKEIFLEKLLARNVKEEKEIVSTVKKSGVKLMVGYDMRFPSSFRGLKEKMDNGILGEVPIAYSTNIASGPFFHRAKDSIPLPVPRW